MHCTFGEGVACAVCLKIDAKTPLVLAGKAAKQWHEERLSKKVLVATGKLSVNKDKRLVLTSDDAKLLVDKDKAKAPAKGQARLEGNSCCGRCNLAVCDDCTLAIRNGEYPVVVDGKLAAQHAEEGKEAKKVIVLGRLFLDDKELLRLNAVKVEWPKK